MCPENSLPSALGPVEKRDNEFLRAPLSSDHTSNTITAGGFHNYQISGNHSQGKSAIVHTHNTDNEPSSGATEVVESSKTAHIACMTCRRRKLKCDGNLPTCSVCAKLGVLCFYESKRKRSGLKKGYVKELEDKLKKIERDKASKTTLEEEEDKSNDIMLNGDSVVKQESPGSNLGPGNISNTVPLHNEVIYLGATEPLPSEEIVNKLFTAYFDIFNYQTQLINEQKFRFLYSNKDLISDTLRIPVYLVYAVMLVGMDYVPSCLHLESTFYTRARKYLEAAEISAEGNSIMSIRFIQACCLLSHFEHKRAYFPRGWLTAGRACRAAVMIKLDILDSDKYELHALGFDMLFEAFALDSSPNGSKNPANTLSHNSPNNLTNFRWTQKNSGGSLNDFIDLDEKRHVLWNCFCTDTYSSVGTGWPMTFDESNIQTFLPISNSAILGKSAKKKRRHGSNKNDDGDNINEDNEDHFEKLEFISHHDVINPSGDTTVELKDISRFSLYIIIAIMHARVHKLSLIQMTFRDIMSPSTSSWIKEFLHIDKQLHRLLENFPQPSTYKENNMARNIMTHIYLSFLDCLLNHHQIILAKTHELFKKLHQSTGLSKNAIDPRFIAEFNVTFNNSLVKCYELMRFSTKLYRTMDNVRLNTSTIVMMSLFRLVKVQLSLLMYFTLQNNSDIVEETKVYSNNEKFQVVKSCLDFVVNILKLWSVKSLLAANYYKSALKIIGEYNAESRYNINSGIVSVSPTNSDASPKSNQLNPADNNIMAGVGTLGQPPVTKNDPNSPSMKNNIDSGFSLFPASNKTSVAPVGQGQAQLPNKSSLQNSEVSNKCDDDSNLSSFSSHLLVASESVLVRTESSVSGDSMPASLLNTPYFVGNGDLNNSSSNVPSVSSEVISERTPARNVSNPYFGPSTISQLDTKVSQGPNTAPINNYVLYNGSSVTFANQTLNNPVLFSEQVTPPHVPIPFYHQQVQSYSISTALPSISSMVTPIIAAPTIAAPTIGHGTQVAENMHSLGQIVSQDSTGTTMYQQGLNGVNGLNYFSHLLNSSNPSNPNNYMDSNSSDANINPQILRKNDYSSQEQLNWDSTLTIDSLINGNQGFNG